MYIPDGIDISKVTREKIVKIKNKIKEEINSGLIGLDDTSDLFAQTPFMLLKYSDGISVNGIKVARLGQAHIMFEGGTGFGKTDMIESLASAIQAKKSRIQGMPDLQPVMVQGGPIIVSKLVDGHEIKVIKFKPGKLFAHIVKLDEGNRANADCKSAFLEAMEERCVTPSTEFVDDNDVVVEKIPLFPVSGNYHDLESPRFFMMLLTQNVFGESEGTQQNPEAELDRITMVIDIKRPSREDEKRIIASNVVGRDIKPVTDLTEILNCSYWIYNNVKWSDRALEYKVDLIRNTNPSEVMGDKDFCNFIGKCVTFGASPRVHFHLEAAARTRAFFNGHEQIMPEDVKEVAHLVIPHRLVLDPRGAYHMTLPSGERIKPRTDSHAKFLIFQQVLRFTDIPEWKTGK